MKKPMWVSSTPERMNFMKKLLSLLLVLSLLVLCGCGGNTGETEPSSEESTQESSEETTEESTQESTEATEESTEESTGETTEETESPVLYHNPLTGETLDSEFLLRPYTVSFNNVQAAMPQYGIGQADILYEFLTEGGTTRCIGLFSDISNVEKIGSIRSARQYFVDLALAYDAIFVHAGGSDEALNSMKSLGMNHIDAGSYSTFYRDQARLNSGYALEHTLFGSGDGVVSTAVTNGYRLNYDEAPDYGLSFVEDGTPNGSGASTVKIVYGIGGKTTTMTYDEESGMYQASQFKKDWIDKITGEPLHFENVLVLYTTCYIQSDNVHWTVELTGSNRAGYFACGGKIVPILWSHSSNYADFVYTLEDGTPLELGIGNTYIAVVPKGSTVTYE